MSCGIFQFGDGIFFQFDKVFIRIFVMEWLL